MPAQAAPATIATTRPSTTLSSPGSSAGADDDGGGVRRDLVLALDADVEQVHPEPDGGRQRGQEDHRGLVDDVDVDPVGGRLDG